MLKKIIQLKLKILAKLVIAKQKPEIVGITGSVGKTSARDAVYAVLKGKFRVASCLKNYNNEFGLPLTVIGAASPGKNIFGWIRIFWLGFKLFLWKDDDYPRILVLEMGIDHPGDMDYLLNIAAPKVGILTMIGTVHAENFGSRNKLIQEKAKLIRNIPASGWSIINYDNEDCRRIAAESRARVITFGLEERSDIRAQEINYSYSGEAVAANIKGINFKMGYKGSHTPVLLPGVLGINSVYAALAAAAVGLSFGMNQIEISEALRKFDSPKGRMRLIPGIKNTTIIDDTYNSEPKSAIAALGALKRIPVKEGAVKFVVLGDMLELGAYSEEGHKDVGRYAARAGFDWLFTVGERARHIAHGAKEEGMGEDRIFSFGDSSEVGRFMQDRIRENDLILVKGSQGMRMEKIVKEIVADPLRASTLLVRQEEEWLK
ncbi:MAG: Mur ligase family protein [Candidatus Falkowbacteria bacterium]